MRSRPRSFGRLGRVGWVPTIELTVHVRRRPGPGWVMGRFRCDDLDGGRMVEDGALWDGDGSARRPVTPARAAAPRIGGEPGPSGVAIRVAQVVVETDDGP